MTTKRLQIFKAGTHLPATGPEINFSELDLQASAAAYDPAIHEAPLVVGHPQTDHPAYGWVKSLDFNENTLEAEPDQIDPEFSEMVTKGRFKKISASFYTPDSPSNPVPGVYYLRHVGFLGAQPPSIKGLRDAAFSEKPEEGVVEFMDQWTTGSIAAIIRRLREWIISKDGTEEADKVIPGFLVEDIEQAAREPITKDDDPETIIAPSFTEPNGDTNMAGMTPEQLKEASDKLKADTQALADNQATFAETQKKFKADAEREVNAAFVESLVSEGKIKPGEKDGLVGVMCRLGTESTVSFGEGDDATEKPAIAILKDFLKDRPKAVDFKERGQDDGHDDTDGKKRASTSEIYAQRKTAA